MVYSSYFYFYVAFSASPSLTQWEYQVTTERVVDGHYVGLQSANLKD